MTLLLNPSLKPLVASTNEDVYNPPAVDTPAYDLPINEPPVVDIPAVNPPTSEEFPPLETPAPASDSIANDASSGTTDCPVSHSDGLFQVLQAEDADIFRAEIKNEDKYFCGTGYVDFENIVNKASISRDKSRGDKSRVRFVGISFVFEIPLPGMYWASVRYANGGEGSEQSRSSTYFMIDSVDTDENFEFSTTFGWSIWAVENKLVTFDTAGKHSLDIFWSEEDDRPSIDWLSIQRM